jgi:hypothetical protein
MTRGGGVAVTVGAASIERLVLKTGHRWSDFGRSRAEKVAVDTKFLH